MFYMKVFYLIRTVIRFHFEGGGGTAEKADMNENHDLTADKFLRCFFR